ncbi:D-cysteine desulfhydrase family protein [Clostridium ganghwense]|uniref:D-cysteine desulfhydrase family protein n=1 Tax=Clostridium ganghwense TaxID=312089 RepID=A0ABT4CJD2_9CLOT|nr:D-cysteine desulfhydrase family protein [Clostridium ganghwense]MCY6369159.1 D-cysteine desulfhydrase family protein [Clostridium ganghwense]
MVEYPRREKLAFLPTPIHKLEKLSKLLDGPEIYLKRDDITGSAVGGNKIRKLEYTVADAIDKGCDTLITCGGLQSNHCRATAFVATKLGLECHLVLNKTEEPKVEANLFLDKLAGAHIHYIPSEEYKKNLENLLKELQEKLNKQGKKAYVIPTGASFGIGNFGYIKAAEEVSKQCVEENVTFDYIVTAVGSGGTYTGLSMGQKLFLPKTKIVGINVSDDREYFVEKVKKISKESSAYMDKEIPIEEEVIHIIDGYVGLGYAKSRPEELKFIEDIARLEGVVFDPVYTGKAMFGLADQIKKGTFKKGEKILFIHTGGIFGIFPKAEMFELNQ